MKTNITLNQLRQLNKEGQKRYDVWHDSNYLMSREFHLMDIPDMIAFIAPNTGCFEISMLKGGWGVQYGSFNEGAINTGDTELCDVLWEVTKDILENGTKK